LERDEKLQKILENLDKQHEAVRKNMVLLVEERARYLADQAREELARLRKDGGEEVVDDVGRRKEVEKAVESIVQKVKTAAQRDARPEDYEIRSGRRESNTGIVVPVVGGGGGDVEMGGVDTTDYSSSRRSIAIREQLSRDLKGMVDRGVAEMEAYDVHAESVNKYYRQALERGRVRYGQTAGSPSAPGTSGSGRNR